ncbi:MAG TPA: hypothetical protein PKD68_02200 [Candidatus Saccharibacteria bacterium]|nr:hypothetical protein [Candidatus Saccharibacteria bacterium]
MSQYKAIFIDWDGTLSNSRFWHRWIGTDEYELIQRVLFTDGREHLRLWMTGLISYVQVLEYVTSRTGIAYKDLARELRYSAEHMSFIDHEIPGLIRELRRKGVKVVVATDNMDVFRLWTVPALGLEDLFDGILVSDSRGAVKVEVYDDGTSKFFHHYLSQNRISPGQSVLIDNSFDAKKVNEFGIDFLHVNNETSLVSHLQNLKN